MPRRHSLLPWRAALACLLLSACGGGGGGSPPPPPPPRDMGEVSGTEPTVVSETFRNPRSAPVTVTLVDASGGFTIGGAQLPATWPALAERALDITLVPGAPGSVSGSVTLRLTEAGGAFSDVTRDFLAEVEAAQLSVLTSSVVFDEVLPGATADRSVQVRNLSLHSTISVHGVSLGDPAFTVTTPLPLAVLPGQTSSLTVRFSPTDVADATFVAQVQDNANDGPDSFLVNAFSSGLQVLDLGTRSFSLTNSLGFATTADVQFDLPSDAIAFQIEGTVSSGAAGLALLTGPGGEVFENSNLSGAYVWIPDRIYTAMVPNTDKPALQIPAGGGTWTFRLLRYSGSASTVAIRVLIQRRSATVAPYARLDLNVFLADGLSVSAATAASDATLQGILSATDLILAQQEVRIGQVAYYDISDPAFDDVTSDAEFADLLELSAAASDVRLNLFFVNTALGGGVLGVSATLGGPAKNGTDLSGVMAKYSASNINLSALVAAHEIGHFIGLYHTVEQSGQHDFIDDTSECPASGTNTICTTSGGGYLMHWQAVGGNTITAGQGLVIRGHPLMRPRLPPSAQSSKPAGPLDLGLEGVNVSPQWCGTCAKCRPPKAR